MKKRCKDNAYFSYTQDPCRFIADFHVLNCTTLHLSPVRIPAYIVQYYTTSDKG